MKETGRKSKESAIFTEQEQPDVGGGENAISHLHGMGL